MSLALKSLVVPTPLGPLHLVSEGSHLVGAYFHDQRYFPAEASTWEPGDHDALLVHAGSEVRAYFEGSLSAFTVPLAPQGTAFQHRVWRELLGIPKGSTTHYGAIAEALGAPLASRAVGAAIGRNPLSLFVPCHRVVGKGGTLTGYAGGLVRKQRLLWLEGVVAHATPPMPTPLTRPNVACPERALP